jgi:glycosyltransferase involved in cell wall biosynthesis
MTDFPSSNSGPRLAIVLSHAIQYYSPWFRWLRVHTALVFRVFYLSDFGLKPRHDEKFKTTFMWDVDLTSGYEWELVPNTARVPDTLKFVGLRNPTLPARLEAWRADAVLLFGYNYHTHLCLIGWARLRGIPLLFRGDSHLLGRSVSLGLKKLALGLLYRQFAAFLYVGRANLAYFRVLGVPTRKLFFAPHSVDATHFDPTNRESDRQAVALRAKLGLKPTTRVVLFAGKLIASKQPRALLEAFLALENAADTALVFVGDGPEKAALLKRVAEMSSGHTAAPAVYFLPFTNQSEMPSRYLLADLMVLPSRGFYETWGLVINEAMHLGKPCLVSDQVGCQSDLVSDGLTGWVFNPEDPKSLAVKLGEALTCLTTQTSRIRAAVAERISHYTYEQTTRGLLRAVQAAVNR